MPKSKPTVREIVAIYYDLKTLYQPWKAQQEEDQKFYDLLYRVSASDMPDAFDQIRPPSATTIVDLAADHSAGNFPRLHVPRRKETAEAQDQSTIMEKAGTGFWYRNFASAPRNVMRAWAQSGALRGAIAGSLLYDPDVWPDKPLPSRYGGSDSDAYKEALADVEALRKSAWPFKLDYIDPHDVYPDPGTEGQEFIIHAFERNAYEVKRAWPTWDYTIPGGVGPLKPQDKVLFIAYGDPAYRSYIIGGVGASADTGRALIDAQDGVVKHGYGFNPFFFTSGGFGSPFGSPEQKYRGILTNAKDLLSAEARLMTHIDAVAAQQAFPWVVIAQGVKPNMVLGGVTVVPTGTKVQDAVMELRPQIPIQELAQELRLIRDAIQRATIPDALGSEPSKSEESGYLRSLKIGTGRAHIRALSGALEKTVEWATSGFYRLVENKVKAPVSVWGKGMDTEQEFVTLAPKDVKGHYEVYASVVPSLPTDESVDIANGLKLYSIGAVPIRDVLETYAGRENAEELLRERLGEDVLKSPPMMQQLIADTMKGGGVTNVTGGPIGTPGFASGELGLNSGTPVGSTAAANPASGAGTGIPTPPAAPGGLQQMNNVIGRTGNGGTPQGIQGPTQGLR